MPFTFCHPAIVLPLNKVIKQRLSLTGLIIGSITPDFEYFIRMEDKRIYTHTWIGLLYYDIALGILLAFIFHNIVRDPLINNLPKWLQGRLRLYKHFNWNIRFRKRWPSIIISFIIGGISHFFWDAFTSESGYFTLQISTLKATHIVAGIPIEGHMIVQVLSSLIGGIIIFYAIWQLPFHHQTQISIKPSKYWVIFVLIAFAIYMLRMLIVPTATEIEDFIIPAVSASLFSLILTPLFLKHNYSHSNKKRK